MEGAVEAKDAKLPEPVLKAEKPLDAAELGELASAALKGAVLDADPGKDGLATPNAVAAPNAGDDVTPKTDFGVPS